MADRASHPVGERVQQPNSRHCFVCGVENQDGFGLTFFETGADEVEADVTIPERFEGFPGVAHGGIVAALLDEITWRASVVGRPDQLVVTGRLDMRLRKPVPVGTPLHLHGRLKRRRARTAEAHGELRLGNGQLAAEADAVLFDDAGVAARIGERDRLGWRVYAERGRGS